MLRQIQYLILHKLMKTKLKPKLSKKIFVEKLLKHNTILNKYVR